MWIRQILSLPLLMLLSGGAAAAPASNANAVVQSNQVRFSVLTPRLIRLEFAADNQFNDAATQVVIQRQLPVPDFKASVDDAGWLSIKTADLTLRYRQDSGDFTADNLSIALRLKGQTVVWHPGDKDAANLGGTARTLDGLNGGLDSNGKMLDLGQGLLSRAGWAVLDDSASHLLDSSPWPWIQARRSGDRDWYFFGHGHDYKAALQDYVSIAGKIPLPPRFAFGYWWSRYWVYSDQELKQLMQEMRGYDIPIDVLVIDMDWHETHGGLQDTKNPELDPFGELLGWTGYSWNKDLFPEPDKFLAWARNFRLKAALNLHPASGIPPMEQQYERFAKQYGFDSSKRDYIPYRMDEKRWAETYVEEILRPLEKQGVDFWWLDWQQFAESRQLKGLDNTWWLNYVFFTDMERQGRRPLLFHRWGGMGNHRYQIGFSGDDKISWESLNYQSYFTATAANVGYGYWSHDIGGHAASDLAGDAELYVRWLQFGVFSPILRTHSAKISTIERRFWMYPQYLPLMRDWVKLRYALNPYIYTAARQAHDSGVSLLRPMYYDWPESDEAYQFKHQYMFGDDILVAPIATPLDPASLLAEKTFWLPKGQWYEWTSGTMIEGGRTISRRYAIGEIPMLMKAGAIVAMYPDIQHLQDNLAAWVLNVLPGDAGSTDIYEDGGNDLGYKSRQYANTLVEQRRQTDRQRAITIYPRVGGYPGAPNKRTISLALRSSLPARSVSVNGKTLLPSDHGAGWSYNGKTLANEIRLPSSSVSKKLVVVVDFDLPFEQQQQAVDGKLRVFQRLTAAVAQLKIEVARENWWAYLPASILGAEQTVSKIQYHPADTRALLKQLDDNYPLMLKQINELVDARPEVAARYVKFLSIEK